MESVEANNHTIDATAFREKLIGWGKDHFRSFPWRFTREPYHILMAEVMLHRTQASQVAPIYNLFIENYPDMASLSSASREDLHRIIFSRITLAHRPYYGYGKAD